jgi:hypothetical protein
MEIVKWEELERNVTEKREEGREVRKEKRRVRKTERKKRVAVNLKRKRRRERERAGRGIEGEGGCRSRPVASSIPSMRDLFINRGIAVT